MSAQSHIVENVGGDMDLARQLAGEFIKYSSAQRPILQSAVSHKDGKELRHCAHQLRGAAGYFSDDEITILLQQMEDAGQNAKFDEAEKLFPKVDMKLKQIEAELKELV